jgi:hypothetical protein
MVDAQRLLRPQLQLRELLEAAVYEPHPVRGNEADERAGEREHDELHRVVGEVVRPRAKDGAAYRDHEHDREDDGRRGHGLAATSVAVLLA